MTKINSRTKGSKGERAVAKLLEVWCNGLKFSRTPSSGGLQWKSANSKGDIICTEEGHYHPFCHEIKTYKDISFEHILYLEKPKVLEFWDQCTRDAERAKKAPMLWMRYDRLPKDFHFIAIDLKTYKVLKPYLNKETKMFKVPHLGLFIITTEALMKVPYKKIRKQIKELY